MEAPNFIGVYPNAASDEYCDRMIQRWEDLNSGKLASASLRMDGVVTNENAINRKDYAFFFDTAAADLATETYGVLNECLPRYIDTHPSLEHFDMISKHVKVQKTPVKGGFHKFHCEQQGLKDTLRLLAWTIYLNDMPDGEAETEYLEYGTKVPAKKGTVCIFPAAWTHTHRGNPVYSHDKYIATGWYYGQEGDSY
jgi:hypothetical protein